MVPRSLWVGFCVWIAERFRMFDWPAWRLVFVVGGQQNVCGMGHRDSIECLGTGCTERCWILGYPLSFVALS